MVSDDLKDWRQVRRGDEVTARYVQLIANVEDASPLTEVRITASFLAIDVPDIDEAGIATNASDGDTVTVTRDFQKITFVSLTAEGTAEASPINITSTGFDINFTSGGPADVRWFAKGY
jgi:hypothetical protein